MTVPYDAAAVRTLEFAGLPGSGKTHWTRFVADELLQAGIRVQLPRERLSRPLVSRGASKIGGSIRAFSPSPGSTLRTVMSIGSSQASPLEAMRRTVQWLDTQSRLRGDGGDGFLLLDEGPLQALWSIGLRGDADVVLDRLRSGSYARAGRAVVLAVPVQVALGRVRQRMERHRRLDRLATDEERLKLLQEGQELLDHLVGRWEDLHGADSVVRIEATQADVVAQRLRSLLRDLLSLPSRT